MERIDEDKIIEEFNNEEEIWPQSDKWHFYTHHKIQSFINENNSLIESAGVIINAGSSGEDYGIPEEKVLHIDIAPNRIISKSQYLISNLERINIESEYADLIICVGSVLNYTEIVLSLHELCRVLKKGGHLILEFECSNTLELLFSRKFNLNATLIKTFYRSRESKIWYFSEKWVEQLLKQNNVTIIKRKRWHILSSLVLGLSKKENFSARFSIFDSIANKIPPLNRCSSNIILLCRKLS